MKQGHRFYAGLLFAWVFSASSSPALPPSSDAIAAIVADEVITVSEVVAETKNAEPAIIRNYPLKEAEMKIQELRRTVANRMVETELLYAEFMEKGYKLPPELVQRRMDDIIVKEAAGSRERFEQMLFAQGLTMNDFEEKIRKVVSVDLLVDEMIRRPVRISPAGLHDYYRDHPQEFSEPGKIRLSLILLKQAGRYSGKQQDTIQQIQRELEGKSQFPELAQQYSEADNAATGGDLGWMREAEVQKDYAAAVKDLKPGQVSAPINLNGDMLLLCLTGREDARLLPFDETIARRIELTLRQQEEDRRYKDYVQNLRKKIYVKTFF